MDTPTSLRYILFVDDALDDCNQVSEAFLAINAKESLRTCSSGKGMFNFLNNLPHTIFYPSLIALGYYLHRLNEEDILQLLKQNEKFRAIPVIIYSSDISPSIKERLINMGGSISSKCSNSFSCP